MSHLELKRNLHKPGLGVGVGKVKAHADRKDRWSTTWQWCSQQNKGPCPQGKVSKHPNSIRVGYQWQQVRCDRILLSWRHSPVFKASDFCHLNSDSEGSVDVDGDRDKGFIWGGRESRDGRSWTLWFLMWSQKWSAQLWTLPSASRRGNDKRLLPPRSYQGHSTLLHRQRWKILLSRLHPVACH